MTQTFKITCRSTSPSSIPCSCQEEVTPHFDRVGHRFSSSIFELMADAAPPLAYYRSGLCVCMYPSVKCTVHNLLLLGMELRSPAIHKREQLNPLRQRGVRVVFRFLLMLDEKSRWTSVSILNLAITEASAFLPFLWPSIKNK